MMEGSKGRLASYQILNAELRRLMPCRGAFLELLEDTFLGREAPNGILVQARQELAKASSAALRRLLGLRWNQKDSDPIKTDKACRF